MVGTEQEEVTGKILTFANLLSLIRLLLLPVFWVLFVTYNAGFMAFLVIMIAALTDLLDGQIARSTHTVSRFGKLFDPFVDRIFIIVAVVAIFVAGRLPLWILILLLLRDALMLLLTFYQRAMYKRDFRVIFIGKLTTALLMIGFCMLVLGWPVIPGAGLVNASFLPGWGDSSAFLGYWFLYLAVIFSWIAAGVYIYKGTRPVSQLDRQKKQSRWSKKHSGAPISQMPLEPLVEVAPSESTTEGSRSGAKRKGGVAEKPPELGGR